MRNVTQLHKLWADFQSASQHYCFMRHSTTFAVCVHHPIECGRLVRNRVHPRMVRAHDYALHLVRKKMLPYLSTLREQLTNYEKVTKDGVVRLVGHGSAQLEMSSDKNRFVIMG